jgi:hypothetical protein
LSGEHSRSTRPGASARQQLLKQSKAWGLTNRRGRPLTSQAIGVLLRNRLYAGILDVTEYGVRGKRGDFDSLVSEDLFYRVQHLESRTGITASDVSRTRQPEPDFR